MDQTTLVREQIEGGVEIVKDLERASFPVSDAYWQFASDEDRWHLCFVVPDLDQQGIRASYKRVHLALNGRPTGLFGVDPYDIRLVDLTDPVAKAIHAFQDKHGDALPTTVRGTLLEGQYIERAFIYPRSMKLK